ncbi:hypothetical protein ACWCY6_24320 [Streptomyces sp. 900105755]|uniref:hypothetical protein n=1 Tax=Streptomyces sp. NPDC001507 TaxID=3364579 RepID=UPI0036806A24
MEQPSARGVPGAFAHPDTGERCWPAPGWWPSWRAAAPAGRTWAGRLDFQLPYLRAWTARLGVRPEHLHPAAAELTRVDVPPFLAGQEEAAAPSLAEARAALARLAAAD